VPDTFWFVTEHTSFIIGFPSFNQVIPSKKPGPAHKKTCTPSVHIRRIANPPNHRWIHRFNPRKINLHIKRLNRIQPLELNFQMTASGPAEKLTDSAMPTVSHHISTICGETILLKVNFKVSPS
jgi:hypothetical protein